MNTKSIEYENIDEYNIENATIQDYYDPDKTTKINNLKVEISRNKLTGYLKTNNFLNDYLVQIYKDLYGKESFSSDDSEYVKIVGTDTPIQQEICMKVQLGNPVGLTSSLLEVSCTMLQHSEIAKHREHYIYFPKRWGYLKNILPNKLELENYSIQISKKESSSTPSDSEIISLSYSGFEEGISFEETGWRNAVVIGFLTGSPLTNFGYTEYDKDGKIVKKYRRNLNKIELLIAENHCNRPILYHHMNQTKTTEVWEKCLTNYWSQPENVQDAFIGCIYRLWNSHLLVLDFNIPLIVSGLEILVKEWGKSKKVNEKTEKQCIVNEDEFQSLVGDRITEIIQKINDSEKIDLDKKNALKSKLNDLNKRRLLWNKALYPELGIELNEDEKEIFKTRNDQIHQLSYLTEENVRKNIPGYYCALTLCHKTLLKILGDDLKYLVDYSKDFHSEGASKNHNQPQ